MNSVEHAPTEIATPASKAELARQLKTFLRLPRWYQEVIRPRFRSGPARHGNRPTTEAGQARAMAHAEAKRDHRRSRRLHAGG